jgi:hypothetical protein
MHLSPRFAPKTHSR